MQNFWGGKDRNTLDSSICFVMGILLFLYFQRYTLVRVEQDYGEEIQKEDTPGKKGMSSWFMCFGSARLEVAAVAILEFLARTAGARVIGARHGFFHDGLVMGSATCGTRVLIGSLLLGSTGLFKIVFLLHVALAALLGCGFLHLSLLHI
mgnify:FL=1